MAQSAAHQTSGQRIRMSDDSKVSAWTGFLQCYKANKYTDVILKVENGKFPCHRVVLASASQYFQRILSSGMMQGRAQEVELGEIDAETLSLILNYIYSADIEISMDNVKRLVQAADKLLITELLELCEAFLVRECCPDNCVKLYRFGKLYRLDQLESAARTLMMGHFAEISRSGDFFNMSAEEVIEYISDSALQEPVEDVVFEGVVSWINVNPQERSSLFTNIIPHIRLPLCSKVYLCEHVQMNPLMLNTECQQYLNEALRFHMLPAQQHQITTPRTQPRCAGSQQHATECLVLIGGRSGGQVINNDIYTLNADNTTWEVMARLPPNLTDRELYSAVGVHNGIILTGGYYGNIELNNCWLLDIKENQWKAMSKMITARQRHGTVVHNDCVYVFGGLGPSHLKSAEMYNQVTNQWTPLPDMPKALWNAFPVSYKKYIYVFGGNSGQLSVNTFAYNTEENEWKQFQDMPKAGYIAGGGLVNDKVYVVVGRGACLSYDLLLDMWTQLSSTRQEHYLGAAVIWQGKLIVSGGGELLDQGGVLVEEYDPEQNVWTDCQSLQLPKSLYWHQLCIIST